MKYRVVETYMTPRAGPNCGVSIFFFDPLEVSHVADQVRAVCSFVLSFPAGYPHKKRKVACVCMHQDFDGRTAAKCPPRLAVLFGLGLEQLLVHNGSIGRLVLQHQDTVCVYIHAEVYVAQSPERVVDEADVAPVGVSSEGEALEGVLDLGRQSQGNGVFPSPAGVQLEPACLVF